MILLYASAALMLRVGMMLYASGLSRSKNAASAGVRSVCDLAVAALGYWSIGSAILGLDEKGVLPINLGRLIDWDGQAGVHTFGFLCLVLVSSSIAVGSTIERSRLRSGLGLTVLVSALVVPFAAQWVWGGWLRRLGFVDSGGAVLHLAGGLCALVAAILIGSRSGKYNRDGSTNFIPGHSAPLALTGALVMVAMWVPMTALAVELHSSSSRGLAMNVLVSGAAAAVVGMLISQLRYGKPDVMLITSALLGGLVAIASGAAVVSSPAAFVIGAVAGAIVPAAIVWIDLRCRIDDPTGSIAIHGLASVWGLLATALLAPKLGGIRVQQLGIQALGVIAISALAIIPSFIVLFALRAANRLRSKEADEFDGLDLAEHDLNAYPDFQQTMIKSYHLREA